MTLPIAWSCVIGFALAMYLICDGFDLGVGILLVTARGRSQRDEMIYSIQPVWDGNETWLVLVGAGLLGGFPIAYGTLLPAFYIPLILMLLCLALRGTAFEFREQTRSSTAWDVVFSIGSAGAALCQGTIAGGLVQGINTLDNHFAGTSLDCITPFSAICGVTLLFGYAALGVAWLFFRTSGTLRDQMQCLGARLSLCFALLFFASGVFSSRYLWLSTSGASISHWRWLPAIFGLLCSVVSAALIRRGKEFSAFAASVLMMLAGLCTTIFTVWPFLVPYKITIKQASSVEHSQIVLLIGALVVIPVILCYTAFSYYVFRGKIQAETVTSGDVG